MSDYADQTVAVLAVQLLDELGMLEELRACIAEGMPVLGTCAGLILLAHDLAAHDDKGTPRLATMDVLVERNAYGRQARQLSNQGAGSRHRR